MTRFSVRDCLRRGCLRGGQSHSTSIVPRRRRVISSFLFELRCEWIIEPTRERISGVQLWCLNVLLFVAAAEPLVSPTRAALHATSNKIAQFALDICLEWSVSGGRNGPTLIGP